MALPATVAGARRWVIAAAAVAVLALTAAGAVLFGDASRSGAQPTQDTAPTAVSPASTPSPSTAATTPPNLVGRPVHVRIDGAGVDADVVPVALRGSVLAAPSNVLLAGWWSAGAQPGSPRGTVLMVGHSVHVGRGVFDRLGRLEAGDRVVVTTDRPSTVTYEVQTVEDYGPEDFAEAAPALLAQDTDPRLVLATCGDYEQGHYRATTVVVATPVQ